MIGVSCKIYLTVWRSGANTKSIQKAEWYMMVRGLCQRWTMRYLSKWQHDSVVDILIFLFSFSFGKCTIHTYFYTICTDWCSEMWQIGAWTIGISTEGIGMAGIANVGPASWCELNASQSLSRRAWINSAVSASNSYVLHLLAVVKRNSSIFRCLTCLLLWWIGRSFARKRRDVSGWQFLFWNMPSVMRWLLPQQLPVHPFLQKSMMSSSHLSSENCFFGSWIKNTI